MPLYTDDDLDDLEDRSALAPPLIQAAGLKAIVQILEDQSIAYGVMGGMNFFLRGSGRTTSDVDIAVDNPPHMEALLNTFNDNPSIHRPSRRMQWASGVARIFVDVSGTLVQIDLKPKGAEGHLIPRKISASTERIAVNSETGTFNCNLLAIGPLVAAKLKSHHGRETDDDYRDLLFVCRSPAYSSLVRAAASSFRFEWKEAFVEKVRQGADKGAIEAIRWTLAVD